MALPRYKVNVKLLVNSSYPYRFVIPDGHVSSGINHRPEPLSYSDNVIKIQGFTVLVVIE